MPTAADRAIRRTGELLKQIEPQQGSRTDIELRLEAHPKFTRIEAAAEAGMSPHLTKQAIRVANIPEAEFERKVESDNPPTITVPAPTPVFTGTEVTDRSGRDSQIATLQRDFSSISLVSIFKNPIGTLRGEMKKT